MNQEEADKLVAALMDMTAESEDYATWNTVRAIIEAAVTPDKPEAGETVRVRIAVAVNSAGEWAAGGYTEQTEAGLTVSNREFAEDCAIETLDSAGHSIHWIEANIPLPTSVTVEGEVVK